MSAWIVSKKHIDAIVRGAVAIGVIGREDATRVGNVLWLENHVSIKYRYEDNTSVMPIYRYRYRPVRGENPITLLRAVHCLDYQSCKHPQWRESEAKQILDRIERKIAELRPGGGLEETEEYKSAPWGID